MKKLLLIVLIAGFPLFSYSQVPEISFAELETRLTTQSDSVYVVNFWATWCVPCVKELPEFEKINEVYADKKVKVLLVSLDNPSHMDSRLMPFVKEHNLKSEIVLLDDPRSSVWIPKVDGSWTGSIPATMIFTKDRRVFYEKEFTYEELKAAVLLKLN